MAKTSLTARLETLPFTKKHTKLLGVTGIGWALDAMDVGLISFIMAALTKQWALSPTETSWLGSIGFLGMALGATVGGLLADRFGRRYIFAATLLIYGLATGASALAGSLAVLMVFRFIVGLGLGAELPVASTLMSEFSPRAIRGRVVVILEAFWALGWILASKGRTDEAERVVAEFESSAALSTRTHADETASDNAPEASANDAQEATSIWSAPLRKRTLALCTVWFCINLSYYGAFIWIPSLLSAQGFSLVKSFAFTLIMTLAQLPGYAVAAYLIEKWGRRATLAVFLAGSAGAAVCYGLSHSDFFIILSGCFLSFFNLGAWGALYAISPEVFPTRLRGTGTGTAAGLGRIASILAPLIVPPLISFGGTGVLFAVFAAAFLLAAVTTFALPEKRGKSL